MVKVADIVFLRISSFVDVGMGAQHYYGKLEHFQGGPTFDVTYPLSLQEARVFNREWLKKYEVESGLGYQEGEPSERFPSIKKVIVAAKKQFKEHWPEASVLVLGSSGYYQPQRILVGPKQFKDRISVLAARYDELDWEVESDRGEMEELEKEWQDLWPRKYF